MHAAVVDVEIARVMRKDGARAMLRDQGLHALGEIRYGPTAAEEKARLRRRSLYIAEDLEAGAVLTPQNLRRIRPGHGLAPKYDDQLLVKRVTKPVKAGTPVTWDLVLTAGEP
jgi:N-acetylneuraminate synthase